MRSGLGKETVEDSRRLRVHDTPQHPDLLNLGQTLLWHRGFISTSPPTAQAAQETTTSLLSGGSGALTAFQHFLLPCAFLDCREMIHDYDVPICHPPQTMLGFTSLTLVFSLTFE